MHIERLRKMGIITKCKRCGKEIFFARTKTGKFMPVNAITLEAHWSDCSHPDFFRRKHLTKKTD